MTISKAVREVSILSSSTIASIIGSAKYERIDDAVNRWILTITRATDPAALEPCDTWCDVLHTIGAIKEEA